MTGTTIQAARNEPVVRTFAGDCIQARLAGWSEYVRQRGEASLSRDPAWLSILAKGLRHKPYLIEASAGERVVGLLPLAYVSSLLFGKFLVSLPYLNSGGVISCNESVSRLLVESAVALADELKANHLELRHECPLEHPALTVSLTSKVHMRLDLPGDSETLWKSFDPKVRNQVRKGEKQSLTVAWGTESLLPDFYGVFAINMRDLGTPVYSKTLFKSILDAFPHEAELCVVRQGDRPVAAALLLHGSGITEVPSASSLRQFNSTNANMLMYWHLLKRAQVRGQQVFDFGRSTMDSNTFRFKKQWGAEPHPATWQYYVRSGSPGDMRRESGKYARFISLWQKLPLPVTRWLGPAIVRGIP